jgi:hypothetical protein
VTAQVPIESPVRDQRSSKDAIGQEVHIVCSRFDVDGGRREARIVLTAAAVSISMTKPRPTLATAVWQPRPLHASTRTELSSAI